MLVWITASASPWGCPGGQAPTPYTSIKRSSTACLRKHATTAARVYATASVHKGKAPSRALAWHPRLEQLGPMLHGAHRHGVLGGPAVMVVTDGKPARRAWQVDSGFWRASAWVSRKCADRAPSPAFD